jgi:hypothetical protein
MCTAELTGGFSKQHTADNCDLHHNGTNRILILVHDAKVYNNCDHNPKKERYFCKPQSPFQKFNV